MNKLEKILGFILAAIAAGIIGITFWSLVMYPSSGVGW